jgi:hypothetical protein
MMLKQQIKRTLKSRYGSVESGLNPFSVEAGINRWSLKRYLTERGAGINSRTLEKLQAALYRLDRK